MAKVIQRSIAAVMLTTLSGCAGAIDGVARLDQMPLFFKSQEASTTRVAEQLSALNDLVQDFAQTAAAEPQPHAPGTRTKALRGNSDVSSDALVRDMHNMDVQLDRLRLSLPHLLSDQDAALADLKLRQQSGDLSGDMYHARVTRVHSTRRQMIASLADSKSQLSQARTDLHSRAAAGQTDLHWHIGVTAQLERDITSVRSLISLH